MTTYNYDTLKISKTLRVDGLYEYNAGANDKVNFSDPTSSLKMAQDVKDVEEIQNKVSFSKAGYVDNKWLVSENGQIFKVSSVLAKEGGVLKSYKTGFASSEFRVDPEEIGLAFQNKPEVKDATGTVVKPANPEFENFIRGVVRSYNNNWVDLFGYDDSVFVKAENRNTPIDAAALRAALNEANPSLLKVLKLIFKEAAITENKKLIEETDLYLRYMNKGITLAVTGDTKYALDPDLLDNLKKFVAPLDPWYKGLKEKAADINVSNTDLIKMVADQLSGVSSDDAADATSNVIAVLAVGEAPVTAAASPVATGNEPDWTKAQAVVDHFNELLTVIRENEGIEDSAGKPFNLKDKKDGKATAINNFTFINTSPPQLVTTDRAITTDPVNMKSEDWSKLAGGWHPVKIDFSDFDDDAVGLFKKKRVDFGKKDATDEKSSIRLLDRYLHKLAGIQYGTAIDGDEIDNAAVADIDSPSTEPADVVTLPPPASRAFNGFEVANEALTKLTNKPVNQMEGVNREITAVKPAEGDEYGVVDQEGTAIMINGKSYPDITSLLIVLVELGLAEKEQAVGKVAEGLVLAIGVTQKKQNHEDQVVKVDYSVTTLGAKEDAKIKAVAEFVSQHPEITGVEIWGNADGGDSTGKYAKFRKEKGTERFGVHMAAIASGNSVTITGHQNSNSSTARRGVTFTFIVKDDSTGPDIKTVDYFLIPFLEDYVTAKNDTTAAEVMKAVRDLTDLNELKVATKLRDNLKKAYGAEDLLVKKLDAHIANLRTVASVTRRPELGDDTFKITSDGETRFKVGTRIVTFPFTGDASGIKVVDDWGTGKTRKFTIDATNGLIKIDLGFNAPKAGDYALVITTSQGTKINVMAVAEQAGGPVVTSGGGSGSGSGTAGASNNGGGGGVSGGGSFGPGGGPVTTVVGGNGD